MLRFVASWNLIRSFCIFSCGMGYVIFWVYMGLGLYFLTRVLESSSRLTG